MTRGDKLLTSPDSLCHSLDPNVLFPSEYHLPLPFTLSHLFVICFYGPSHLMVISTIGAHR